ncbi:MAG: hypothetical protein KDC39_11860 [Actinobacteria bacterium]|nr:hypothetical protein [Actinomycetota bacterium]
MADDRTRDRLMFGAGAEARRRGLAEFDVVTIDEIDGLTPAGRPVLIVASAEELSSQVAWKVAAVLGAGRELLVVSDRAPEQTVLQWLPEQVWSYPGATS